MKEIETLKRIKGALHCNASNDECVLIIANIIMQYDCDNNGSLSVIVPEGYGLVIN
jgi:hypothetical protein